MALVLGGSECGYVLWSDLVGEVEFGYAGSESVE